MKLYESIRKNLNESEMGNEYIVYCMEQTGPSSYRSKEVDRVYSAEQAEDRCAELRTQGFNTWYEVVSSDSDDYEEYDDGDTNWAAEEASDADERFENRYMGGGNGTTFNESNRKMTDYEKAVKRNKENEEAFVKVDSKDGHFALVYPNSVSGNTSYFADFFAADGKYENSSYIVPDNLDSETLEKLKNASSDNYYAKPLWFNDEKLYNDYRSSIEEQLRDGALDDPEYVKTLSDDEFKDLVDTWVSDKENKEIFEDHIKYDPKYAKYFYKNGVSIKEAEEDTNSQWLVDTSGITITNGGYHNNEEVLYGRVRMLPRDKNEIARNYDIIYIPENDWLEVYKPGTDVRSAVEYGYLYDGDHDNNWVKWNGQRVQIKDLPNLRNEVKESIPGDIEQELLSALSDLYFDKDKHRLANKINYD